MRVLVVEDEYKLGEFLKKGLTEHGFVVEVARDGIEGRRLAIKEEFEIIVLDLMLPGVDGLSILASVRETKKTPVLVLTARDRVEDRVRGLQEGADDYLVKPFAFSELLARMRALMRRSGQPQMEVNTMRMADLELDVMRRKATRAGQRLLLTGKEFALLLLLLQRRGEILGRSTLAELVWDMNFDSNTNVVEVAVRRLRAKLDDPFQNKLLHTVRGMGYVLEDRS
jgi:two-component system copper resistance phosphate regulon response regulator CusR